MNDAETLQSIKEAVARMNHPDQSRISIRISECMACTRERVTNWLEDPDSIPEESLHELLNAMKIAQNELHIA